MLSLMVIFANARPAGRSVRPFGWPNLVGGDGRSGRGEFGRPEPRLIDDLSEFQISVRIGGGFDCFFALETNGGFDFYRRVAGH